MRKLITFIIMVFMCSQATASTEDADKVFNDSVDLAKSKINVSVNSANQWDMSTVVDGYTSNPSQSKYYKGVKQKEINQLKQDAVLESNNENGKAISDSIKNHPYYTMNENESGIKGSNLIISDAYNITHGITDQYSDCKPKETCSNTYNTQECTESAPPINQMCQSLLSVSDNPEEIITHYKLNVHISASKHSYAGATVNTVTGALSWLGPHDASFRLDNRLPATLDCKTLEGSILSQKGNVTLDTIDYPSCSNGMSLNIHISNGHNLDAVIDISSKSTKHEFNDQWSDDCSGVASITSCLKVSEQCDEPNETRTINGEPVTRECWKKSYQYVCHGGNSSGTCQPLKDQGCEQIDSMCTSGDALGCKTYKQTFRCPVKTCSPTSSVVCGDGVTYCLDGDCTDHGYKASPDFGKAVSALSSTDSAGSSLDQSSLKIFTGKPYQCSTKPLGFSNCCTEKGWGQDTHLDSCPIAAKELHIARENLKAIYVGKYRSGFSYEKVYCVYDSIIARIIQDQGRAKQLHINFGNAKHPNCNGITVDQLQAINLSSINFDDFISDISNNYKVPDLDAIRALIQRNIDQMREGAGQNG